MEGVELQQPKPSQTPKQRKPLAELHTKKSKIPPKVSQPEPSQPSSQGTQIPTPQEEEGFGLKRKNPILETEGEKRRRVAAGSQQGRKKPEKVVPQIGIFYKFFQLKFLEQGEQVQETTRRLYNAEDPCLEILKKALYNGMFFFL